MHRNQVISDLINEEFINTEEKEFYMYGLEILEMYMITILSIVIVSIIFHNFYLTMYFCIHFLLIRNYTGGFHFNKKYQCLLFTLFVMITIPLIIESFVFTFPIVLVFILFIILIIIDITICPVIHKNKVIKEEQINVLKKKGILVIIFYLIEYLILQQYNIVMSNLIVVCIAVNIANILAGKYISLE